MSTENNRIRKCLAQKYQVLRAQKHGLEGRMQPGRDALEVGSSRTQSQEVPCCQLHPLPHPSRLGSTSTAPQSLILLVRKAEGTRRLSPTQHCSSGSLSLTPLSPRGEERWGSPWEHPGGRSSSSILCPRTEAASCSLYKGSMSPWSSQESTHTTANPEGPVCP